MTTVLTEPQPKLAMPSSQRGRTILAHLKALETMDAHGLLRDIARMVGMESFHQGERLVSPRRIVQDLRRGPSLDRYACGVCTAFGKAWFAEEENWNLANPLYRVFAYHEVPRIYCRFKDQEHFGPRANEIYERCIATYRAAGWTSEAQEPDA